jgi:hypothetical protein
VKETTLARLLELWDSSDALAAGKEILQEDQKRDRDEQLIALLRVAEIAAKVAYNATGLPAPFDHHAGWRVAPCLRDFAAAQEDAVGAKRQAWDLLVGPLRR